MELDRRIRCQFSSTTIAPPSSPKQQCNAVVRKASTHCASEQRRRTTRRGSSGSVGGSRTASPSCQPLSAMRPQKSSNNLKLIMCAIRRGALQTVTFYPTVSRYSATTRTSSFSGSTMIGFSALLSGRKVTSSIFPSSPTFVTFHRLSV